MAERSSGTPAPALGRRQLLQRLAAGTAGGLVLPASLAAGETQRHVHDQLQLARKADAAAAAGPALTFFDAHQKATLASLAERIVPGAAKADVAGFLDRLVAVDAPPQQRELVAALGAIDAEAQGRFGRPWLALDAVRQDELLSAVSTAPPSRNVRYAELPVSGPPPATPTIRDRFDLLKLRVALAYYTSEIGLRELGYTGELIHETFAGCPHPEGHP